MAVSDSPWWWLPELLRGPTCACPIQTFSEPTLVPEIASRRLMLPLWAVSVDISAAGTCRSGRCQSSAMVLLEPSPPVGCRRTVPAPGEGRRYRVLDTARSGPSLEVTRVTCHVSPT